MISHCSGPHSIGGMMPGMNGEPYVAHVYRVFPGFKLLRAELDGKVFENSEAANKAILERGYGELYFPRSSVVIPTFAELKSQRIQAEFDAKYRYWKYLRRNNPTKANKFFPIVKALAAKVGIFHPCARVINQMDLDRNKLKSN
jgi:hypothetical protein